VAESGCERRLLPETVDGQLVDRMAATRGEVALGSLPHARNRQPAIVAALPHIAAPIVAINPATASADVASLRRHGVEPMLLEDVGHFPMIEAPDRFNAVLGTVVASLGS
jgi:pimeloyl-ACP methyl ester carboxylesterase